LFKKKCKLEFDDEKDIPVCKRQASGMIGFAEIIMKDALNLNGKPFDVVEGDNPYYRIWFDAKQIKEFMERRLIACY